MLQQTVWMYFHAEFEAVAFWSTLYCRGVHLIYMTNVNVDLIRVNRLLLLWNKLSLQHFWWTTDTVVSLTLIIPQAVTSFFTILATNSANSSSKPSYSSLFLFPSNNLHFTSDKRRPHTPGSGHQFGFFETLLFIRARASGLCVKLESFAILGALLPTDGRRPEENDWLHLRET